MVDCLITIKIRLFLHHKIPPYAPYVIHGDFSPALAAFSDEEDGNDDQYIEIALERPMNGDHPDDGSNQLEFCISFSSSVPFLQVPSCGLARADTVDSIGSVDSSVPFLPNCGLARADTVDSVATVDSIGTEFSDAVTTSFIDVVLINFCLHFEFFSRGHTMEDERTCCKSSKDYQKEGAVPPSQSPTEFTAVKSGSFIGDSE
ncbi:hypothetical protein Patl1_31623 [Pistacia atlantica]|uniref:Uncharacterized protein n=1 Tax=Pistacia atlantica TaxID=434234 RepID=A0ACC1AQA7_9ROSI|nr:hypothetical protein Patl1_31623 [Pistacia atlantica]